MDQELEPKPTTIHLDENRRGHTPIPIEIYGEDLRRDTPVPQRHPGRGSHRGTGKEFHSSYSRFRAAVAITAHYREQFGAQLIVPMNNFSPICRWIVRPHPLFKSCSSFVSSWRHCWTRYSPEFARRSCSPLLRTLSLAVKACITGGQYRVPARRYLRRRGTGGSRPSPSRGWSAPGGNAGRLTAGYRRVVGRARRRGVARAPGYRARRPRRSRG